MTSIHAQQLSGYIKKATADPRLNTSHLSIYLAMISCWQKQGYVKRFRITRKDVMELGKIAAISTYHRCMKQLIEYGYVLYEPTYDSYTGTRISLMG